MKHIYDFLSLYAELAVLLATLFVGSRFLKGNTFQEALQAESRFSGLDKEQAAKLPLLVNALYSLLAWPVVFIRGLRNIF